MGLFRSRGAKKNADEEIITSEEATVETAAAADDALTEEAAASDIDSQKDEASESDAEVESDINKPQRIDDPEPKVTAIPVAKIVSDDDDAADDADDAAGGASAAGDDADSDSDSDESSLEVEEGESAQSASSEVGKERNTDDSADPAEDAEESEAAEAAEDVDSSVGTEDEQTTASVSDDSEEAPEDEARDAANADTDAHADADSGEESESDSPSDYVTGYAAATNAAAEKGKTAKTSKGDPEKRAKHAAHGDDGAEPGLSGFSEIPQKKSHRGLKIFGITVASVVVALAIIYAIGVIVFMGRFLPHTILGDHDVSMRSDDEVVEMLKQTADNYQIDVVCGEFNYHATGDDLGIKIDAERIVDAVHRELPSWKWPVFLLQQSHDESQCMDVSFDRTKYEAAFKEAIVKFNETATPPTNATIVFSEEAKAFSIAAETIGTQIDPEAATKSFAEAINELEPLLVLPESDLLQPTRFADDAKLMESVQVANAMTSANITLVMAGNEVRVIGSPELQRFVSIDENLEVAFKDDELSAWCAELADGFNTIGTERTYTRADGKVITVSGGAYGWEIDQDALKDALIEAIKGGQTASIDVPLLTEAYAFVGPGERDWGPRYIDVDISEQHVRFYDENGNLFWETDCITGAPDGKHDTVTGVWKLNDKESPSTLKGFEGDKKIYETKVTFWMPFERNAIGFHDATWQPSFGGNMYARGYGSHGCVNLSYAAAEELYGLINVGDVVIVHY